MDRSEYDLALADFGNAVELQPDNADFYLHRSMAYDRRGEVDRVIDDLNSGLRLDRAAKDEFYPLLAQAHRNRAKARLKLGDSEGAAKDFQRADRLERSPGRITIDPVVGRQGFRSSHGAL